MIIKAPELKKSMLLGLVASIVPLFYFPGTFGWSGAQRGTPQLLFLEFGFYVLMFYLLNRRENFKHHLQATAMTLGSRVALGTIYGLLVSGIHGVSPLQGLAIGLYSYLPFVWPLAVLMPFLIRPAISFRTRSQRSRTSGSSPSIARDFEEPPTTGTKSMPQVKENASWQGSTSQLPDFGAAVEHVASYSTVELAILVDQEGLCVSKACRGNADSEMWAPVVNLIDQSIRAELVRTGSTLMSRFELTLATQRLVVERVGSLYLAVVFDQATDELVNVRIAQAIDMVKKYQMKKYPKLESTSATEVAYV